MSSLHQRIQTESGVFPFYLMRNWCCFPWHY